MATDILPGVERQAEPPRRQTRGRQDDWASTVRWLLSPLASLKLTVVLFALSIVLVLAGTLAQVEKDIWFVVHEYFRVWFAWIDLQIFLPRTLKVAGAFPFPGGSTIGLLMAVNLLAAHGLRFKMQARGGRLTAGLIALAIGVLVTWGVIQSGSSAGGVAEGALISWGVLWNLLRLGVTVLWLAGAYWVYSQPGLRPLVRGIAYGVVVASGLFLSWLWIYGGDVLDPSAMRILWQLIKGGIAGLVLLVGCVLLFNKRAGIVLLHGGVGLLMLSELLVAKKAVEGQMYIKEGQTVNFVQDVRELELAVVNRSADEHDAVTVVPKTVFAGGGVVKDEKLPFDIKLVKFIQNSDEEPRFLRPGEKTLATAGAGLKVTVDERRPGSGTDTEGAVDMSAAYVKLLKKGTNEPLGTYLVGLFLARRDMADIVQIDDQSYELSLRFKRTYKPYSLHLEDFRFDRYVGTNTPKNYSSDLRLVDETRHVDRHVKIWMNNPLRFADETFYQSSFLTDARTKEEIGTILQVVSNSGWMIPYVACMIVATGMLTQFSISLVRFLNRRRAPTMEDRTETTRLTSRERREARLSNRSSDWLSLETVLPPLVAVLVGVLWLVVSARSARSPNVAEGAMHLDQFGQLPVMFEGRVKPMDTLARNSLRIISDKQSFVDSKDNTQPAIRWLLDVAAHTDAAYAHKVFRIHTPEILSTLGLKPRKGFRYAIDEFRDRMPEVDKQVSLARQVDEHQLSVYQKKMLEFDRKLRLFTLLSASFDTPSIRTDHAKDDVLAAFRRGEILRKMQPPLSVPPNGADEPWESFSEAWTKAYAQVNLMNEKADPATLGMSSVLSAYAKGDAKGFNLAVAGLQQRLIDVPPSDYSAKKTDFEAFFNRFGPFFHAAMLYFVAFLVAAIGWLAWPATLRRTSLALIVLALAVHTFALVARIYISGRPPVTNLYSSAVFIGWGGVALGLILELIYRIGVGSFVASIIGFSTLQIAHDLAAGGDTFTVLQAVLDTQFWLATHVTCITLGYATTFIAGLLGLIYVLRGVFTPSLSPQLSKKIASMIYGTLCFALFFSFVGTVLGGLWADDSWGRFWGWDPKENGALIIVLWNALVLHARWDGMVKDRGMAVLAVFGNITTAWSWFGVNELGAGLHSYGFTEGIAFSLLLFVMSQLAIVGIGCLPRHWWWSNRVAAEAPA